MRFNNLYPLRSRLQDCRGNTGGGRQTGRAKQDLSILPRQERQGNDCRLEVGSQPDPSYFQCALSAALFYRC